MAPKVGIVATSDRLTRLIPLLQSLNFPVTAIWCRSQDNCRSIAKRFGIALATRHFQELLVHSEVDLVYVATDPVLRAEVAVKAITSGKHCISLNPICVSCSDGEKMLSVSQYYPQLLSLVECHMRFLPASVRMRELLETGFCGKVLVVEARVVTGSLIRDEAYSWKCEPSVGGGALSIVGSHIIDLMSFTTRLRAQRVHGSLKTFRPQTAAIHGFRRVSSDDFCSFQAELDNQAFATVTINTHAQDHYDFEFSVTGTKGRLTLRGLDLYGTSNGSGETLLHKQEKLDFPSDNSTLKCSSDFHQPYLVGCHEMFCALKADLEHSNHMQAPRRESLHDLLVSASFEDGLYVRTVLDAVARSSGCGQWIDVAKVTLTETNNPFWTSSDARFNVSAVSSQSHPPMV
jgi:predicted dehydrogenase